MSDESSGAGGGDKSRAPTPEKPVLGAGADPLVDEARRIKLARVSELLFLLIKLSETDPTSLDKRRELLARVVSTSLLDGGEDGQMTRHAVTLSPRLARRLNQMAASMAKLSRFNTHLRN